MVRPLHPDTALKNHDYIYGGRATHEFKITFEKNVQKIGHCITSTVHYIVQYHCHQNTNNQVTCQHDVLLRKASDLARLVLQGQPAHLY